MTAVDLGSVVDALAQSNLLFKQGKGGLLVSQVSDGVLVFNVNKKRQPIRLVEQQITGLSTVFPSLPTVFGRNADMNRRTADLAGRLKSPFYSHFVSLDPAVPDMPQAGAVSRMSLKDQPKLYAAVDTTNPSRPSVAIWAQEFLLKGHGRRPDEAMFSFDADARKLSGLSDGSKTLKDVLPELECRNTRAVYFDDNNPLFGAKRVEHHVKSIDTLESWVHFLRSEFNLQIVGDLFLHTSDQLDLPPGVLVDQKGVPSSYRPAASLDPKDSAVFSLSTTLSQQPDGSFLRKKGGTYSRFIKNMSRHDRAEVLRRFREMSRNCGKVIELAARSRGQ